MNLNEMKFVDNTISYNRMVNYITFVTNNSFDEKGRFHQYKFDYALAVALIAMYTDYTEAVDFDEVMEFIHTNEWYELVGQMGKKYEIFKYYVDCEIENMTKPFAFMNETILLAKNVLEQINQFMSVIDKDKLKDYDFTELLNTLSAITDSDEKEEAQEAQVETQAENEDNSKVVKFNKE